MIRKLISFIMLGCVAVLLATPTFGRTFTARVISPTNAWCRQPIISDTGTASWLESRQDPDIANAHRMSVIWWKNDERRNITVETNVRGCERPALDGDTLVFVSKQGAGGGELSLAVERPLLTDQQREMTKVVPTLFHSTMAAHDPARAQQLTAPDAEVAEDTEEAQHRHLGSRESWDGSDIIFFNPQTGGKILTAGDHRVSCPVVSDRLLAWQAARVWPYGYEIVVVDREANSIRQVTTNFFYNTSPNVQGDYMVFQGWDGFDYEIYLYNATTKELTQITDNQFDDTSPVVWDGEVAWVAHPTINAEIFHWKNGEFRKISTDSKENSNPQIWNGNVVWQGRDGDDFEIFLYDGSRTVKITSNTWDDIEPRIRDGLVVWTSYVDSWDAEIMVMDLADNIAIQLTDNELEDVNPVTAGGKVIWQTILHDTSIINLAE